MRSVVANGGRLELIEGPEPAPGPAQVQVVVRAAGLNRADLLMVRGGYVVGRDIRAPVGDTAPPPAVPMGGELAGEVTALGAGVGGSGTGGAAVGGFAVGDRVMAMGRGG